MLSGFVQMFVVHLVLLNVRETNRPVYLACKVLEHIICKYILTRLEDSIYIKSGHINMHTWIQILYSFYISTVPPLTNPCKKGLH